MTHDELLEKVDSKLQVCTCDGWSNNCWEDENQPWKVLRAVVGLHTPIYDNSCSDADCCGGPYPDLCNGCGDDYPCPTIQEIEKELT